jgi:hypothetical protein
MTREIFDKYLNWSQSFSDIEERKTRIAPHEKNFKHDALTQKMDEILKSLNIKSALDYGAGLCRNLPLLKLYANRVDYLDLQCYKEHTIDIDYDEKFYINLTPEKLNKKYDLIYASVVLQHIIDIETVQKIIKFMSEHCKYLLTIQHPLAPYIDMDNKFELIFNEQHLGHVYSFYKSSIQN